MMSLKSTISGFFLFLSVTFIAGIPLISVQAQQQEENPFTSDLRDNVAEQLPEDYRATGEPAGDVPPPIALVVHVIGIALSFMGIGTIILMIYAGFMWMTSGGQEEKVTNAKKTLKNALIGLILITMAYTITSFVVQQLFHVTYSEALLFGVSF